MAISGGASANTRRLKAAAKVIRDQAAVNASAFSRRIPVSMTIESDGPEDVHIEQHREIAPNGYPFEYGVWHPLNRPKTDPRKHWYKQPYRPFIETAMREKLDEAVDVYAKVVDDWCMTLHFRPGN